MRKQCRLAVVEKVGRQNKVCDEFMCLKIQ